MNIAAVINSIGNVSLQTKAQQTQTQSNQVFGNIFGQLLSSELVTKPTQTLTNTSDESAIQDLLAILDTKSMEELEGLLDSTDLTVNLKDLKDLLSKLLGETEKPEEQLNDSNVWDLLAGINEQSSKITEAIVLSMNGDGTTKEVNAKQAIEMLKIVQLIGNKSDLTIKQESTLFDIQQLLKNVKEALSKETEGVSIPKMSTENKTLSHMQHIMTKQVTTSVETVIETKEVSTNGLGQSSTLIQNKVETVSISLPSEKPGQPEAFIKELQKMMNRVQFGQAGGANRLVIKLYPEHLGTVRIELIQKDGILTTKMLASTALGKELLDSNSSHLKQSFANQNIQMDKIEITQALQDADRQERSQSFQESFREQQQQQEADKDESESLMNFDDFMQEMEV